MFEFTKKETLIQNIAFMALMGAINLVITLLMTFIPFIVAITLIFLPLTSVLVTLYCKKRYYPLYMVTTLGLCLLVTMYNISDALFFVLPSLISGFIFGIFIEIKLPSIYLIVVPSLISLGFTYLSVPFIQLLYGINFLDTIASTLSLSNFKYLDVITPTCVLLFCIVQSLFSYMVIKDELKKFMFEVNEKETYKIINIIVSLSLIGLMVLCAFIYLPLAYIFLTLSIFINFYFYIDMIANKNKVMLILNLSTLLIIFFLFSVCYEYVKSEYSLLLINGFSLLTTIYYIVNIYLHRTKEVAKIEEKV